MQHLVELNREKSLPFNIRNMLRRIYTRCHVHSIFILRIHPSMPLKNAIACPQSFILILVFKTGNFVRYGKPINM